MPKSWSTGSQQRPAHDGHTVYPESSPPNLLLPLDFKLENSMTSFEQSNMLEKAMIRHHLSWASFDSTGSTCRSTTPLGSPTLSKTDIVALSLPPKRHTRMLSCLRYTVMSVYGRLFSFIIAANTVGLLLLLRTHDIQQIKPDSLATWASTNFVIAILVRQDFYVNAIFRSAWLVPWSVPLRVRRIIARVYTYGGIHSGAAVAGTMWFMTFTPVVTIRFVQRGSYTLPVLVLSWSILILLALISLLAFPQLRSRYHNTFEMTHRFLGWATILLFWAQLLLLIHHSAQVSHSGFSTLLIRQPTFWNLALMTAMLAYPWLRLRKWEFVPEKLSSHAMRLHFTKPVHRFSCLSISSSPLKEWHPFATFPSTDPLRPGASLIVSAAGDWTTALVNNTSAAKMQFWVKGSPKAGVLSLSCIFKRVVIVTTGSGIGPSLSSLLDRPTTQVCRLVWSTRSPAQTYGKGIVDEVARADPDAVIIDTDMMGRPDLVQVAWKMYQEIDAEAVFVLSNEAVTRKVVYGLESRGVPAYGPIFDS